MPRFRSPMRRHIAVTVARHQVRHDMLMKALNTGATIPRGAGCGCQLCDEALGVPRRPEQCAAALRELEALDKLHAQLTSQAQRVGRLEHGVKSLGRLDTVLLELQAGRLQAGLAEQIRAVQKARSRLQERCRR